VWGAPTVGKNWSAGGEGEQGVRAPKMVRVKCALHEKRVRVQFFSLVSGYQCEVLERQHRGSPAPTVRSVDSGHSIRVRILRVVCT
jgi:hypothetical protein